MEDNSNIINYDNNELINSKEDFLKYAGVYHKKNTDKLQVLIDKDWSFLQKVFGPKNLIKIAQDQRIFQIKNRFDMMNKCDEIVHEVIVGTLKQKAQIVLTNIIVKGDTKLREDIDIMFRDYLMNIDTSRGKFLKYLIEKEKDFENYKDSKLAYEPYMKAVISERDLYFEMQMERTNQLRSKLNKIEQKFN